MMRKPTISAAVTAPVFELNIPANEVALLKFQTQRSFYDFVMQRVIEGNASRFGNGLRSEKKYLCILIEQRAGQTSSSFEP